MRELSPFRHTDGHMYGPSGLAAIARCTNEDDLMNLATSLFGSDASADTKRKWRKRIERKRLALRETC